MVHARARQVAAQRRQGLVSRAVDGANYFVMLLGILLLQQYILPQNRSLMDIKVLSAYHVDVVQN